MIHATTPIRRGIYDGPYFRIALHHKEKNRQHCRLKALANRFPNTYYVAPEICDIEEFNRLFMSGQITNRARLIPLNQCKDINDSEQHYITFQQGIQSWHEHSEKEFHERSILGMNIIDLYRESEFRNIDDEYIREIFIQLQDIVLEIEDSERMDELVSPTLQIKGDNPIIEGDNPIDELRNYNPVGRPRHEVFDHISYILSTFFGTTMVIVGKDE